MAYVPHCLSAAKYLKMATPILSEIGLVIRLCIPKCLGYQQVSKALRDSPKIVLRVMYSIPHFRLPIGFT